MSEHIKVAVAVEGPTDAVVIEAIIDAVLEGSDFEMQVLQPETSTVFGPAVGSERGLGWPGVFRWCRQAFMEGGGHASSSTAFAKHDVVMVHVDADVAGKTYSSAHILDPPRNDLPCERRCPPASATTSELRDVVLNWLGEKNCPQKLVLCMPSKTMDAWVVAALWPDNRVVARGNWECHDDPGAQFSALPKASRLSKRKPDYERRKNDIGNGWPIVASKLTEARRFKEEFLAAVG
ncbi:MAG: hypothetical protein F4171_02115 [Gammaproteobacteria bacterium]|nr:hypothetical protein [Gammaproteobacteria bacterium]MYG11583.1 hypothetical protein [Gammaproteobacteria bacterium]MYK29419.1 hypothetical protein [Gammaproteobacteria bacterium]